METIEIMLRNAGIDWSASVSDTATLRRVNKLMRARDESNLWPISGSFSATERAIRFYRRVVFPANGPCSALEYALGIDGLISGYVNDPRNF